MWGSEQLEEITAHISHVSSSNMKVMILIIINIFTLLHEDLCMLLKEEQFCQTIQRLFYPKISFRYLVDISDSL